MTGSEGLAVYVAPVVTMDPDRPRAEAFAVRGDLIVAVGSLADVVAAVPDGTPRHALEGVVLPGLIDAHLHMQRGGLKALTFLPAGAGVAEFIRTMHDTFDDEDWPEGAAPTVDDRVRGLSVIQPLLHALGFTGVVDPAATPTELAAYQVAHARGILSMRTVAMPYLEIGSDEIPDVDAAMTRLAGVGASTGFGDDTLRLGPIKVYADGEALKGQALLDEPWDDSGYTGLARISDDDFGRLVAFCAAAGWGVGTHAVGGAAIAMVARAYQSVGAAASEKRYQFIHAYLEPSAETIALGARTGAIASLQPSIIWHNGVGLRAKLGERAERANPMRSWIDAGAVLALGSDGPYFAFDPRHLIWQSVTRRIAGDDRPLDPAEAVTVDEALAGYTTGAAYASLAEGRRGMIREGMLADWALWSASPADVPIDQVRDLLVLRTDVGGRTVHRIDRPGGAE
ncbi:amidohydrolase [Microbacterium rhizomatis]|uniref:Amidohydrolase family protein n=1 Tax=Microbacterium rhizomatis TaxID=1631477 RepID=A0A5J5J114_9MICO|nr:amidohydrolase family protein [Microbacterium rhizomatis]KAA9108037.1 amidohydrolase family protein [Microbacterium rhizomatis]